MIEPPLPKPSFSERLQKPWVQLVLVILTVLLITPIAIAVGLKYIVFNGDFQEYLTENHPDIAKKYFNGAMNLNRYCKALDYEKLAGFGPRYILFPGSNTSMQFAGATIQCYGQDERIYVAGFINIDNRFRYKALEKSFEYGQ